ncbi:GNAT family N-acetyltransferase [Lacihabitans sp. CS3-21]|uniref:GNAT family N-acetyltransferase n=1 Tax=Lacihabitans sp. CS3-21 TaxID=2487332 RepID=UPI0020CDB5D5|nr:GNAT family N-acetyltransferase [Lacihabitans sp. CS3-21]MCP9748395.1 N-acetyltransferase [Lacihabitans sp. CS3-21]
MELRIIERHTDKSDDLYSSDDCQMLLQSYDDYYQTIGFKKPWVGYFVVRQNQVVGSCGFTGQPQDGKVEIAYWTFKAFEGQRIASFSCQELVSIARKTDATLLITAKTAPEQNASTKILQKNGFQYEGIVQDHEIGDAWLWTLPAASEFA